MSGVKSPSSHGAPRSAADREQAASLWLLLDDLCDRYEAAWLAGDQPRVEEFLDRAPAERREAALRELLKLEAHYRRAAGEPPTLAEWRGRFQGPGSVWLRAILDEATVCGDGVGDGPGAATDDLRLQVLPDVPGYDVLELLGRGGMGVVYKARHRTLDRLVALKMISSGDLASPEMLVRFRAEARYVASLQHPHLVQVFEVGETQGRPYLALEYVSGGALDRRLNGEPVSPRAAARLVKTLAHAMHFAHARGVVHRDLKPANILLAPYDASAEAATTVGAATLRGSTLNGPAGVPESAVSPQESSRAGRGESLGGGRTSDSFGVPKIADFGLAKHLEGEAPNTRTGAILGTPGYMAPEQAAGSGAEVGPAADIYALGAILYELLAGRPPFRAPTVLETLEQVRTLEPVALRRIVPTVPRDLETICLKCLHKAPNRRYETAGALADDLDRWLRDEPVLARPVRAPERVWRWCRRHPLVASLATLLLLVTFAGFSAVYAQWREAERQRGLAERNADAARRQRDEARSFRANAESNAKAADESRRVAEAAREEAERSQRLAEEYLASAESRFRKSRDAVQEISAVGEQLLKQPQMESAGRRVLEKAAQLQESLLQEKENDPKIRWDTARQFKSLGGTQHELGYSEAAEERTQQAIILLEQLAQEDASNLGVMRTLREARTQLGLIRWARRDLAGADESFREGLRLAEELANRSDRTSNDAGWLGRVLTNWGEFLAARGAREEALVHTRRAAEILRPLAAAPRSDEWYRAELALTLGAIGELLWPTDRVGAEKAAREALVVRWRLWTGESGYRKHSEYLARSLQQVAEMCRSDGRKDEAASLLLDSHNVLTRALGSYPDQHATRERLQVNFEMRIAMVREAGDLAAVQQLVLGQSTFARPPVEESESTEPAQARFARLQAATARIKARTPGTGAIGAYDVAVTHFRRLDARRRDPRKYGPELLAVMSELLANQEPSLVPQRRLKLMEERASLFPDEARAHHEWARLLLTTTERHLRDPTRAAAACRRALELEPDATAVCSTLGAALAAGGKLSEAREVLEENVARSAPSSGLDLYRLAAIAGKQGRTDEARELFARAEQWHCERFADDAEHATVADETLRSMSR